MEVMTLKKYAELTRASYGALRKRLTVSGMEPTDLPGVIKASKYGPSWMLTVDKRKLKNN